MKLYSFLTMLTFLATAASADDQAIDFYVYSEKQSSQMTQCGVSYSTSIAAIDSALRYNRIAIASKRVGPAIYVNINALPINRDDGKFTGYCAINYRLSFENIFSDRYNTLQDGKIRVGTFVYCEKGGTGVLSPLNSQYQISNAFRSYVDECVTEIQNDGYAT